MKPTLYRVGAIGLAAAFTLGAVWIIAEGLSRAMLVGELGIRTADRLLDAANMHELGRVLDDAEVQGHA